MYGLTEAFRSTYLPPEEVDRRPDSIGKAIPNAEILVLREDGTTCAPNEPGELVHRGALVAMGYWNDPEKTAERYKPLPGPRAGARASGDRRFLRRYRANGRRGIPLLHRPSRRDDQDLRLPGEPHRDRGSALRHPSSSARPPLSACRIPRLARASSQSSRRRTRPAIDEAILLAACRERLPAFMVPAKVDIRRGPLPRNPNGKIDRKMSERRVRRCLRSARMSGSR